MRRWLAIRGFTVLWFFAGVLFSTANAQTEYRIRVGNLDTKIHKNFLGVPKSADVHIQWRVLVWKDNEWVETSPDAFTSFTLLYSMDDSSFSAASSKNVGAVDTVTLRNLEIGKKYFFKIQGISRDNRVFTSRVFWILPGKEEKATASVQSEENETSWIGYLPISGRFPLTLLGYGQVFDRSTILGKVAFHVIWWFFIIGIVIWIYCALSLSLAKIFPMKPFRLTTSFAPFNYEYEFKRRSLDEFFGENGIIGKWKQVISEVASQLDRPANMEGDRILDVDKLRTNVATWWRDKGRVRIQEIQKEVEPFYEKYPTARIIQAGLRNHEINGFKFLAASEEVDRAIENRAVMELEQLKSKSKLEWLWNLGATAPLIGLFGTVTGISVSFRKLAVQSQQGLLDTSTKITELAGGINEALWTTILGLSVGIFLIILYYVYKNKLDWIYAKWEQIYVDVSETL
jgi:biopolymer transport protein ExbB/TolQ